MMFSLYRGFSLRVRRIKLQRIIKTPAKNKIPTFEIIIGLWSYGVMAIGRCEPAELLVLELGKPIFKGIKTPQQKTKTNSLN
jgi:hypothetical protein